MRPRDERGSVTPLIIGFAVVVALLVAASWTPRRRTCVARV